MLVKKKFPRTISFLIGISTLILFVCSSLRHALFQSNALDLGIFDNALYLISQGQEPFVVFRGIHILGDHAAFILYPLALLYKVYPDVHWLFAIQAIALSLGALPTWYLARHAGLKETQATAIACAYLLYPLVFNVNLFDFHPEVIAIPAILAAVLAARLGHLGWFCLAIISILSCKAVLSMTVAAMGLWLLVFEQRRLCGAIAMILAIAWFAIATQSIIPAFSGAEAAAVSRYDFLGDSVIEIAVNLFLKPTIILSRMFTLPNLEYLILLLLPIIWGLSPQHLTPLISASPILFLNLLTDYQPQKDLVHQYSLPILPFLLLAVISALVAGKGWLRNPKGIILWSLVAFLALAKFGYFGSRYLERLDNWQATRQAIAQIDTKGSVLTTSQIAPHLTHRPVVQLAIAGLDFTDLTEFEYVLLNLRHPSWGSSQDILTSAIEKLQQTNEFQLTYQRDDVFVFTNRRLSD